MFQAGRSKIGEGDFSSKGIVRSNGKFDSSSEESYLYLFDADSVAVGIPPVTIISEDASDAYEIADAGGDLGKGLRKKSGNTSFKRAYFNNYETFPVAVKAKFFFYITNVASYYQFLFGITLIDAATSGGTVGGFARDAGTGQARYSGYTANTSAGSLLSRGALRVSDSSYSYYETLSTGTLYTLEMRIDTVSGKPRFQISADLGQTRSEVAQVDRSGSQSRIGFIDGISGGGQFIHLKRVEVNPV